MQKQCAWPKMKSQDEKRGAGATTKAFVLNKTCGRDRITSEKTRDLQNDFSLKHWQEDCAKECENGKRWTLSSYIESSRTLRKNTGNIGMHGSGSKT